jgi:hypothetical protein
LWHIFDKSNSKLDVAASVEEVKPMPDTEDSNTKRDNNHSKEDADNASGNVGDSLIAAL